MERMVRVKPLDGYRLEVEFDDGAHGIVEISDRLFGPVFEPLRDPAIFDQAAIDDFGAVCWPNGADLAPDALYLLVTGARPHIGRES
jgi:hypothetical protein